MTRRRWIADEVSGDRAALTGEHARHLAQVLRAKIGEEFDISVGSEVRRGRIISVDSGRVEFEVGEFIPHRDQAQISIALSIFKFDRMEWSVEKCTELGVARIIPLIAARTERHLAAAALKRAERWRKIAKNAAEQSRRIGSPEISDPIKLIELFDVSDESKIVLSEIEHKLMLRDAVAPQSRSVLLAFGPEGGWKQEELSAFHDHGWVSASLGSTILRVETAAIASVAIASSLLKQ